MEFKPLLNLPSEAFCNVIGTPWGFTELVTPQWNPDQMPEPHKHTSTPRWQSKEEHKQVVAEEPMSMLRSSFKRKH